MLEAEDDALDLVLAHVVAVGYGGVGVHDGGWAEDVTGVQRGAVALGKELLVDNEVTHGVSVEYVLLLERRHALHGQGLEKFVNGHNNLFLSLSQEILARGPQP